MLKNQKHRLLKKLQLGPVLLRKKQPAGVYGLPWVFGPGVMIGAKGKANCEGIWPRSRQVVELCWLAANNTPLRYCRVNVGAFLFGWFSLHI